MTEVDFHKEKKMTRIFIALLLAILCLCFGVNAQSVARDNDKLRVLVVTGGGNYETTFYELFNGYNDLAWTEVSSDSAAFETDIRDKYDVVVMFNRNDSLAEAAQSNLRLFVESGKGIVVLHHALGSYNSWQWWWREVVGGRYLMKADGNQARSVYHQNEEIIAQVVAPHPITASLGARSFILSDETYKGMQISPDVKVLLSTGNMNSDEALAWVSSYKKSKVIVIQPGHARGAHLNLAYRMLVRNAILWTSGRLKE